MIAVLTGAGISRESGLQTFRDQDGLWAGHRVEEVCTPHALARNRRFVLDFYNQRRKEFNGSRIKPNAAHLALAELEQKMPGKVLIITQNIMTFANWDMWPPNTCWKVRHSPHWKWGCYLPMPLPLCIRTSDTSN